MGGSHDLENLITLCEACHTQIHRAEPDSRCCIDVGGGPTRLGAAIASVTGPPGRLLARLVDALSLGVLVVLGALAVGAAFPRQPPLRTLAPLDAVWSVFLGAPGVAIAWTASFLGIQSLLAVQPVVRRISPPDVPEPPIGRWSQWLPLGLLLLSIGLVGVVAMNLELLTAVQSLTLGSLLGSYAVGLIATLGTGSLAILSENDESAGIGSRWRRLSLLLSGLAVGGLSLVTVGLEMGISVAGLSTPVLVSSFLFRPVE